jgi:predicted aspartyl protease
VVASGLQFDDLGFVKMEYRFGGFYALVARIRVVGILAIAFLTGIARAEVSLSWDSTGHVVVPAMVNGKGPFEFILDTGADESAVYSWFAKSLHLPVGKRRELSGATGSAAETGTRLSTLAVDGHLIGQVDADTLPDRADGAKLAGVVGVDVILHRLAIIDFGCGTAALVPIQRVRSEIVGAGATLVKAGSIRDGKQLTLPVTVNGAIGVAVLDTGARQTLINYKFASAAGVNPESAVFRGVPTRGVTATSVTAHVGPIGTVSFAGVKRRQVVARVVDLPTLEGDGLAGGPAMILGLDLLRGTRLTVDYTSRRFWLAQSSCASRDPR